MKSRSMLADVVVIGAGPAGSAAASMLARRGRNVVCVERDFFPRYTIGESLLPRCNELLEQAGLLRAVFAKGYQVKHGACFLRGEQKVRFRFADGLPGQTQSALQVPRDDFDQTLATQARRAGAQVQFGQEVQSVVFDDTGACLMIQDRESRELWSLQTRFVLDCSGAGRVLPRLLHLDNPGGKADRTALFTMVEGDLRPSGDEEGDIWVTLHPNDSWLWVIPFSNGRTSVGVVMRSDICNQHQGCDRDLLFEMIRSEPNAYKRLEHAEPVVHTRKLEGWLTSVQHLCGGVDGTGSRVGSPTLWALAGNAGDFLDPIFSSGVSLALEAAILAEELIDQSLSGKQVDWHRSYELVLKEAVGVFRTLVQAWYRGDLAHIFFAHKKTKTTERLLTSILAGYVLNRENPFVCNPESELQRLLKSI